MIFCSVEFRNSPETKVPGAAEDLVTVINHISLNGSKYNADVNRLCIGGTNGGAHICLSASILMAKKGNSDNIKAQFLWCPMINKTNSNMSKEGMPEWEKPFHGCGSKFFELMADNF